MKTNPSHLIASLVATLLFGAVPRVQAQASLPIYTDHLVNGFQDWSWLARNLANTSPVHWGANSISASGVGTSWQALSFAHPDFNATVYENLIFWANGGTNGGQRLQVSAQFGASSSPAYPLASALPTNTWQQFVIPLSSLGVANATNLNRLNLQLTPYGTTNTFFVDDVQLTAKPAPALVHLSINATQTVRGVEFRWAGLNTAVWDGNLDRATTISLLKEAGMRMLRFPGGSLSDTFHWRSNYILGPPPWTASTWFTNFAHVATNTGAQAFITVNYGSGSAAEAAAWVRYSNLTNRYGFAYWEIGNENYGTWEFDMNTNPPYHANEGWSYATRAADYYAQMKAADPSIKVGIVVTPGEDNSVNGYTSHPATNAMTGQVHYGWTPVVLATLKSLGVTPDFAVYHRYPEYTDPNVLPACPDSDPLLLQTVGGMAADAADLRQQLSAYLGPAGANVELVCTENNSDAGAQGRQSTSLVNGLYYADSLGQLMQTELNAFVWWDLRNGTDTSGSFDPTLYGWRANGDLGMIGNLSTRYPAFYAAKLMQYFAQSGDTIVPAASDYPLLSAYAARRASGAVSLVVLNKDTTTNFSAQVALQGFTPSSSALLRSFGIPQDETTRTNGPAQGQDIATNTVSIAGATFNYIFPALSLNLFSFAPSAPSLAVVSPGGSGSQFVLQLQGQSNVRYVLQNSSNLGVWNSVSTNTLAGSTLNFTNPVPAAAALSFWRAVWQP